MTVGAFFFFYFVSACLFVCSSASLPSFTGFFTSRDPSRSMLGLRYMYYWVLLGFNRFYWVFTGFYWVFIIDESIMSFYHLFLLLIVLLYTRRKYFFNILFRIEKDFVTEFLSLGRRLMLLYRVIFQWKRDVNRTKEKAKRNR